MDELYEIEAANEFYWKWLIYSDFDLSKPQTSYTISFDTKINPEINLIGAASKLMCSGFLKSKNGF